MKRAAGRLCVFLVTGTWVLPSARAQSRLDSLQRLDEVVIEAQTPVKEVIPAQRLAGDGLQRLGAHSVADAIRYFSGVQIKDYGGVGGLKTVNIRSMGTNHVGVFYDGIEGYISEIAAAFDHKTAQKIGTTGANIDIAVRVRYNPNAVYQWYLVISLIVILARVISLMLTSLSVARERELGTFEQLIVSPCTAFELLVGKTVPPLIIALILQAVMTTAAVFCFDIPFTGSPGLFFFASFVSMLSLVGVGLFISSVCRNQQQAVLGAFSFIMPAVLLSGFVSPVADMPVALQYLTYANPLRFFIDIGNALFLKDVGIKDIADELLPLAGIAVFTLYFAARTFKRNLE